jgi:hypothetical protein
MGWFDGFTVRGPGVFRKLRVRGVGPAPVSATNIATIILSNFVCKGPTDFEFGRTLDIKTVSVPADDAEAPGVRRGPLLRGPPVRTLGVLDKDRCPKSRRPACAGA